MHQLRDDANAETGPSASFKFYYHKKNPSLVMDSGDNLD